MHSLSRHRVQRAATLLPVLLLIGTGRALAATFTVTTPNSSGAGSLNQAILDANANPGADTIAFAIPGPGPFFIAPPSLLPTITESVSVDGRTQPGYTSPGPPLIQLDGSSIPSLNGLEVGSGADGSSIYGLSMTEWGTSVGGGAAIRILADDVTVGESYVGLAPDGSPAGNFGGIIVRGLRARIGGDGSLGSAGNVISSNTTAILIFLQDANDARILGNYVGTDPTGLLPRPNRGSGAIQLDRCSGVIVGGSGPGQRNVISGNTEARGVRLQGVGALTASGNEITGNYIGVGADGTTPLPNEDGVVLQNSTDTFVVNNLVAANLFDGVLIEGISSDQNALLFNTIGFDAAGDPLPNGSAGVRIDGASGNIIGAICPQAPCGNRIAYEAAGVSITDSSGTVVLRNEFEATAVGPWLPIDLGDDGATPNDPGDFDFGANDLQNSPELIDVTLTPGSPNALDVTFFVDSDPAGTPYPLNVELHVSNAAGTQIGEFLGNIIFESTDFVAGEALARLPLSEEIVLGPEDHVAATATSAALNTSEFSEPFAIPEPSRLTTLAAGLAALALVARRHTSSPGDDTAGRDAGRGCGRPSAGCSPPRPSNG